MHCYIYFNVTKSIMCCRSVQCSSYQWRTLFLGCKDSSRETRPSSFLGQFAYIVYTAVSFTTLSRLLDGSIFSASFYHQPSRSLVYHSSTAGQVAVTTGIRYVTNSLYLVYKCY